MSQPLIAPSDRNSKTADPEQMRARRQARRLAFVLAPLLVALTTRVLIEIQSWLQVHEGITQSRAFTTLFYLVIVSITLLGGRAAGLWTVALSLLATDYFVMLPRYELGGKVWLTWCNWVCFPLSAA